MPKVTLEHVAELLPEVEMIADSKLKETVCKIWQEAVELSNWPDMDNIQFNALCPGSRLVAHTRAVANAALGMLEAVSTHCGAAYDRDAMIVEALLHDVCKVLENDPTEDGCKKNKIGKTYQHGFLSGYFAQKYGLPSDMVSAVVSHTNASRVVPHTLEGIYLFYADMACADYYRFDAKAALKIQDFK